MVWHQAVGDDGGAGCRADIGRRRRIRSYEVLAGPAQKEYIVLALKEDGLAVVTAIVEMVILTCVECHLANLSKKSDVSETSDFWSLTRSKPDLRCSLDVAGLIHSLRNPFAPTSALSRSRRLRARVRSTSTAPALSSAILVRASIHAAL